MLSVKENERLTRVGPGTPMGQLLRRYWHPIAATAELDQEPTKAVKLLGESLVLYKDRSGALGLIGEACPHRRVNMLYGIPEQDGLRCPYHGWLFNETGRCLEMPAEAPDSTFPQRVTTPAYPVQEMGGLIWTYLGPKPAPLLPRWEVFVREGVLRDIGAQVIPCNWVQAMENSVDPVHLEWLHGKYLAYVLDHQGKSQDPAYQMAYRGAQAFARPHMKIGFDVFEHGIIKRRVVEGRTEEDDEWRIGHPLIFPNILYVGNGFQIRVPMDDTRTLHYWYNVHEPYPGVQAPKQDKIPFFQVPVIDEKGLFLVDWVNGGDTMAWATQGSIAERSLEKLAESDKGIILYRRMLQQQMALTEDGGEPMNVFRDPVKNVCIPVAKEGAFYDRKAYRRGSVKISNAKWSPIVDEADDLMAGGAPN
jgi:5,5'-dehydrodivanillate O-demethylase